jgi:hypothetical protein
MNNQRKPKDVLDLDAALYRNLQSMVKLIGPERTMERIQALMLALGLTDSSTPTRKLWDVWMEGYATNGERAKAELLGSVEADSFHEACVKIAGKQFPSNYDSIRNCVWGCRLFPTGEEAAKLCG